MSSWIHFCVWFGYLRQTDGNFYNERIIRAYLGRIFVLLFLSPPVSGLIETLGYFGAPRRLQKMNLLIELCLCLGIRCLPRYLARLFELGSRLMGFQAEILDLVIFLKVHNTMSSAYVKKVVEKFNSVPWTQVRFRCLINFVEVVFFGRLVSKFEGEWEMKSFAAN